MEQYSIYEGYMDDLRKKVNKIQKKCEQFGCDFHFAEVGEEYREMKIGVDDEKKDVFAPCRFVIVEADGVAKLNDWEFVGSVEYTKNGNIFSKALNNVEIPVRYRTTKCICEHCNVERKRKDTFIVHNTVTDEFKQVGRNCLEDFTHGMSVKMATYFMSLKGIFQDFEDRDVFETFQLGYGVHSYETNKVLHYVAETIRIFGYAKEEYGEYNPNATKRLFKRIMQYDTGDIRWLRYEEIKEMREKIAEVGFNSNSEKAEEMVKTALEWLDTQEASNDYMHNLKTVCGLKYVDDSKFGILVSLFPTYDRELEKQAYKKAQADAGKLSKWVGKVGDKVEVEVDNIKCISSWETSYGYYPTTTYVWKITDVVGNVYTWKTTTFLNEPKLIKGTVKEHTEFREVKQTCLTRCKVIE